MVNQEQNTTGLEKRLRDIIEPVIHSEGFVLIDLLWQPRGKGHALRLFVDRPDGGITLDECAFLSRQVSDLLDVEDPIEAAYNLEVSSPGLDRPLKTPRDYEIFAGRLAKLTVREPDGGTTVLKGRLKGLMAEETLIEVNGRTRAVSLDQVAKARLEPEL